MVVKILGILDIIAGASFWLFSFFSIIPESFILLCALYLIAKGIIFVTSLNAASILDIISGIIILLALAVSLPTIIPVLVTLYLLPKGIFSLF